MSSIVRPAEDGIGIWLPDNTLWIPPPHPVSGRIQTADELIPRVCEVPAYAFSSGPECIELAASAGLMLDPWEQLSLILGLGETAAGKWAAYIVALIVARQNGKGADLEALGLYWLFGSGEMLIGHTAHEYKTAMEAFRRLLFWITNTDWMRKKVKKVVNTNGEEGIELLDGRRMRFLARSKGAGRGFTFHKLIWDEAYALTEEQQEAQLPTLSAVLNGQIWMTSSPPLTSDTGKPLFTIQKNAPARADIAFMDYGAAGDLEDLDPAALDDEDLWVKTNPNAPERISLETIRRERAAMSDRGFARERLCIWPPNLEEGFTVISREQWEALKDENSGSEDWTIFPGHPIWDPATPIARVAAFHQEGPPTRLTGRPAVCPVIGPRRAGQPRASVSLATFRNDGLAHLELVKNAAGTEWLIPALVDLAVNSHAVVVIDPGSATGSILADLKKAIRKGLGLELDAPVDKYVLEMTTRNVAQAFGMIYDAATRPASEPRTVVHLGQEEIVLALGGAETRDITDSGRAWDQRESSRDITGLVAMTNALWGLSADPGEEGAVPMVMWL
jgi:hypothetical protein